MPKAQTQILLGLSAVGTLTVLLRTADGIGMSVSIDSDYYIGLARALAGGGEGVDWLLGKSAVLLLPSQPFPLKLSAWWPPMYPMLLSAASGLVLDVERVAGPLNAVAFGLTIFVAGQWMRVYVQSSLLLALGCSAIAFSAPLTSIASIALSETVFMLFATTGLFFVDRWLRSQRKTQAWLLVPAAITALACVTRYSGVVIVGTVLPLIFWGGNSGLAKQAKRSVLFLCVSASLLVLWMARNYWITETLAGTKPRATPRPVVPTVGRGFHYIEEWVPLVGDIRTALMATKASEILGIAAVATTLVLLLALVVWACSRWWRGGFKAPAPVMLITVAGLYGMAHIAFTLANAAIANLYLDARQLAPSFIPMTAVIVVLLDVLLRKRIAISLEVGSLSFSSRDLHVLPKALVVFFGISVLYAAVASSYETYTVLST